MSATTDEGRHVPAEGASRLWQEAWEFEAWWDGGDGGFVVHVSLLPGQRRAWYWMALVRAGEPLVTLADLTVPLPRASLQVRTAGLWAEHVCEEPMDHWSVANEAHAVALDEPDLVYTRPFGDVVAVALDVGFEDRAAADDDRAPRHGVEGYERTCDVHGEVLLGAGRLALDGVAGRRRHWWGERGWATRAWGSAPEGLRAPVAIDDGAGGRSRLERVLASDGWHEANMPRP